MYDKAHQHRHIAQTSACRSMKHRQSFLHQRNHEQAINQTIPVPDSPTLRAAAGAGLAAPAPAEHCRDERRA